MHSTRLKEALKSTELLSLEIKKRRSLTALNDFIDERINATQQAIQPLTEDIQLCSVIQQHNKDIEKHTEELKTEVDESGVIKTEEMCYTPFPFVQSETLLYPNGRKIVTVFYPHFEKIPARMMESHSDGCYSQVTYDKNGNIKASYTKTVNPDKSYIEENIDYKNKSKEVKYFNSYKVAIKIENYIQDRLSFKMECDGFGNIISESTYFAYAPVSTIKKLIKYNRDGSYTNFEYSYDGKIITKETRFVKK